MIWQHYIEQNPEVMLGKPVIKGTRITIDLVLECIAEGASWQDILDAYPRLSVNYIKAALEYANVK